ncbi:hypothetical protein BDI4_260071 [Burkholderia diffusa]|nr:hypothetical protein BDI4_260071 [Burkholderia diffusa]
MSLPARSTRLQFPGPFARYARAKACANPKAGEYSFPPKPYPVGYRAPAFAPAARADRLPWRERC